jgi:hypothetical protein
MREARWSICGQLEKQLTEAELPYEFAPGRNRTGADGRFRLGGGGWDASERADSGHCSSAGHDSRSSI